MEFRFDTNGNYKNEGPITLKITDKGKLIYSSSFDLGKDGAQQLDFKIAMDKIYEISPNGGVMTVSIFASLNVMERLIFVMPK